MPRNSKQTRERELADNARLLRAWKRWHTEQLEEALAGVHGAVIGRMMAQLKDLKSARELVDAMVAEDWSAVDANTRLVALHQINAAITALRLSLDADPISDPLPGQPDNAFRIIKSLFNSFPPSCGKASRGDRQT